MEDSYGAGDLMVAPTYKNTYVPTNNVVGTTYEYLSLSHDITNLSSSTRTIEDCYVYYNTYDESLIPKFYTSLTNSCCDGSEKCGGGYVLYQTCDTYVGPTVTQLIGTQLQVLALTPCGFISGSSQSGGVIQSTDTLFLPELLGNVNSLGGNAVKDAVILTDLFSGTCFTIVGKSSTINTNQTVSVSTSPFTLGSGTTDCNNSICHCLEDIDIENLTANPLDVDYKRCGENGKSTQSIPAASTLTMSDCININTLVWYRVKNSQISDVIFNYNSVNSCDP